MTQPIEPGTPCFLVNLTGDLERLNGRVVTVLRCCGPCGRCPFLQYRVDPAFEIADLDWHTCHDTLLPITGPRAQLDVWLEAKVPEVA